MQVAQLQSTESNGLTVVGNPVLQAGKDSGNKVRTLAADSDGNVLIRHRAYSETLFGGALVSNPYTLLDSVNKYYIDPLDYGTDVATGGTVTHLPNESAARIAVTATSASRARLRTNTFFRYQAGKAQTIIMTGYHSDTGQTNQTRRWGYFDDNDGLFFQATGTGTTLSLIRRTSTSGSAVDNSIARASWNGDKLDGTGASGITLDITKANLYEIRFQWLGVGIVQWWINGILVHTLDNSNTLSVPYMKTAVLPVQIEVINTGASSVGSFTNICNAVRSEGGGMPPPWAFGASNTTNISVSTTEIPLLSIRPKSTFQGLTNRILSVPVSTFVEINGGTGVFRLVLNGSLTGASFSSANADSGMEFDVAATAMTGGSNIYKGFLILSTGFASQHLDLSNMFNYISRSLRRNAFDTSGDTLTIMAVKDTAGSANFRASLAWQEIR